VDHAPGFPSLTYGRRKPPAFEYVCFTPRPSIPSLAPTFWFSDTDQTNTPDEIYCKPISGGYGGMLRKALALLEGGIP
jgi:hypothetical protein